MDKSRSYKKATSVLDIFNRFTWSLKPKVAFLRGGFFPANPALQKSRPSKKATFVLIM